MGNKTAIAELQTFLGQRLSLSKSDLDLHGQSEAHFPHVPPEAVAYPETTDEVSKIADICNQYCCPIVGWGAGTSIEGQAQAFRGGVCIDFSRMNQIIEVRPEDMTVTVQPGILREQLNNELRITGLCFPVDPGANASIGGMAATRASGTTAVRYGTMRDNVMGVEAVLASGEVIRTGTRARKSSAGYDLTGLMVGSEGTLGLMTELTLRLHGQPEAISGAVCAFHTVADAVNAATETIQMGIPIARIELVDTHSVRAVNAYSGSNLPGKPHLLVEFHGSEAGVAEQTDSFRRIAQDHRGLGFDWATRAEDRTALWAMRHTAYHAILAMRPGARAITTDVCVPISQLAETVEETQVDLQSVGLIGPILGHVGDGNFHAVILFDEDDEAEKERAAQAARRMVARALARGGTSTGEHGVGVGKLGFMSQEHGPAWGVMGAIKHTLDPNNILNPGKLVPPRN